MAALREAVTIPLKGNAPLWTILIPGGVSGVLLALWVSGQLFSKWAALAIPGLDGSYASGDNALLTTLFTALIVLFGIWQVILPGYYWQVQKNWLEEGPEEAPPSWIMPPRTWFVNLVNAWFLGIVMILPVMLGVLTFGLAMPFALSLYVKAIEADNAFAGLYQFKRVIKETLGNYLPLLKRCCGLLVLHIGFSVLLGLSALSVFGVALVASWWHASACAYIAMPTHRGPKEPLSFEMLEKRGVAVLHPPEKTTETSDTQHHQLDATLLEESETPQIAANASAKKSYNNPWSH